jgi:YegS C-terminal NAD kinase beta sandwich-like domain
MLALGGRTTGAFRRDGRDMDAMIMEETDEDLKDKVGSAAHFVPAGKALGRLPVRMTVQLDTNRPVRRHAMLCVIGNVGTLRGNLTLIPGASPDDGLLDLYIASPADSGTGPSLRYGSLPDVPRRLPLAATAGLPVELRIIGVHQLMLSGFFMCDCLECRSCITTTVSRRSSFRTGAGGYGRWRSGPDAAAGVTESRRPALTCSNMAKSSWTA